MKGLSDQLCGICGEDPGSFVFMITDDASEEEVVFCESCMQAHLSYFCPIKRWTSTRAEIRN